MEIYTPDTKVMIKNMIIEGVVKSVEIGPNFSLQYIIGWWNESTYVTGKFSAAEISGFGGVEKLKIGFK